MKNLSVKIQNQSVSPSGNWNTAADWFPSISINQETWEVEITKFNTSGRQAKASISTNALNVKHSLCGTQVLVTGEVDCRNWKNYKTSGTQTFCYAIFVGDTNHIYVHRAPATKGWLNLDPNKIRQRLVKLGIGAVKDVLQQGDFLLKPANGSSQPIESFKHEWNSASHHRFDQPVLSQYVTNVGRFIYIPEGCTVELHHYATDGIQHPTITVPAGQYIIGNTANGLNHSNQRD